MQGKALLPRSPTDCLSHPPTSRASFQCSGVGFLIKKKKINTTHNKKHHTLVKAETFQGAVSLRQTFAKSQADFRWQPARFANPQPPKEGSQDASRARSSRAGEARAAEQPLPAPVGGHGLQAPLCTGARSAGIPRLTPWLLSLFSTPAALWSWGRAGSVN